MKPYLINSLKEYEFEFDYIVTLLDYRTNISICLKSIRISSSGKGKILIDTILCSGMNKYRFIETTLNDDGTINLNQYNYVSVNDDILEKANDIVKHNPICLKNSVLPKTQIEKL